MTPSIIITDADRREAAVLTQWISELGLDREMLGVLQDGLEQHLAIHRENALLQDADWRERQRVDECQRTDDVLSHHLDDKDY